MFEYIPMAERGETHSHYLQKTCDFLSDVLYDFFSCKDTHLFLYTSIKGIFVLLFNALTPNLIAWWCSMVKP